MSKEFPEFIDDKWCFACGRENPFGLKMDFEFLDDRVISTVVLDKKFQGFKDILHGGIVALLLDEIMAWSVYKRGIKCATAKLELRLKKPVYTNVPVRVEGMVERKIKNTFVCRAFLCQDGIIKAEAKAIFVKV